MHPHFSHMVRLLGSQFLLYTDLYLRMLIRTSISVCCCILSKNVSDLSFVQLNLSVMHNLKISAPRNTLNFWLTKRISYRHIHKKTFHISNLILLNNYILVPRSFSLSSASCKWWRKYQHKHGKVTSPPEVYITGCYVTAKQISV